MAMKLHISTAQKGFLTGTIVELVGDELEKCVVHTVSELLVVPNPV